MKTSLLLLLTMCSSVASAQLGAPPPENVQRALVNCGEGTMTVTAPTTPVTHQGGNVDVIVDNPNACSWLATITPTVSFATITFPTPPSTANSSIITITFQRNRSANARPVKLYVGGGLGGHWIALTQEARAKR